MYKHEVQNVDTEIQNNETEILGFEGEKESTGKICLHCMTWTTVLGLIVVLAYFLICTGIVFAIP